MLTAVPVVRWHGGASDNRGRSKTMRRLSIGSPAALLAGVVVAATASGCGGDVVGAAAATASLEATQASQARAQEARLLQQLKQAQDAEAARVAAGAASGP